MVDDTHEARYDAMVEALHARYADCISADEVRTTVADSRERLRAQSTVDAYEHIFVERFAKERLRAMASERSGSTKGVQRLLFVCNGNAGRSQMAAAFAAQLGGGRVEATSAGVNPMSDVLPDVRTAMAERDVSMPEAFPKPMTNDVTAAADVLVSIGVPVADLPGTGRQTIMWDIAPVVGQGIDTVRATRDDIEQRVRSLVADLLDDGQVNLSSGDAHRDQS